MSLLQMSVSAGMMIIVIIIARALAINRLPKRTFLILWGLALARMLLPFSFPSLLSVYSLANRTGIAEQLTGDSTVNIAPFTVPQVAGHVSLWLLVWIGGVMICALYFAYSYFKYHRKFIGSLPVDNSFVAAWLVSHKLKRRIEIRQSSRIKAPLTYGILHPIILMPKHTDWADTKKLQYVFQHEYVHIRRFDTVTKILLTGALCVHWFNPLAWAMYILANRDLELSCDESVVRSFGETIKSAYAMTLISMEEQKSGFAPFCNNFSKNAIEERITSIMKIKKTSLAGIALALVLVAGTTTVFATSAFAAPQNGEDGVKTHSYTDKDGNSGTVAGENVKRPERHSAANLNADQAFLTKEDAAKAEAERTKPRVRTEEELKQIIADIESGKIKPLDITALPDDVTAEIVDSDGNKTILKQSGAVKDGSAMDTLNSK